MNNDTLTYNRLILCHFDTYSSALLIARFGSSVLVPEPLPEGATVMPGAEPCGAQYEPAAVVYALASQWDLAAAQLTVVDGFDEWMNSGRGPIRIHLARFTTFEAPRDVIDPHGGVFKPISEMRGIPALELNLLRRVFNLMMGGS